MIQPLPESRSSLFLYLDEYKVKSFPLVFYKFLHPYISSLTDPSLPSSMSAILNTTRDETEKIHQKSNSTDSTPLEPPSTATHVSESQVSQDLSTESRFAQIPSIMAPSKTRPRERRRLTGASNYVTYDSHSKSHIIADADARIGRLCSEWERVLEVLGIGEESERSIQEFPNQCGKLSPKDDSDEIQKHENPDYLVQC